VQHPRTVYLREDQLIPPLDRWLSSIFTPGNIEQTFDQLVASQPDRETETLVDHAALAECDKKLARYRAALEAGADPALIAEWTSQVKAERAVIEARSRPHEGGAKRLTREEIRTIVATLADVVHVIEQADPRDKTEIYHQLGLRITRTEKRCWSRPDRTPLPCAYRLCPRGDLNPHTQRPCWK
jgi:hypothetical protein